MGTIREDISKIASETIETHISWVFLTDSNAIKVKKPVALGFLDFSSIESRRHACEAELVLNRRLAPDVYLKVSPVTLSASGEHRLDGEGEIVDWAVVMRRLDEAGRADTRLERGALDHDTIDSIARKLAEFHDRAPVSQDDAASMVEFNMLENFEQAHPSIESYLNEGQIRELESWQRSFVDTHLKEIRRRQCDGRVREGHGDLRLEHVYIDAAGEIAIVDCIEFNQRFRVQDVCADISFLSMDLAWHGRQDLAEQFLAAYAKHAGDFDLYALVDFFESYRAYVRGKIAASVADDPAFPQQQRDRQAAQARRYYLLALAAERRFLTEPAVIAVGGMIASGKSTVASRISRATCAPVVDTDRTRKQLAGVSVDESVQAPAFSGAYEEQATARVYEEMFRRARVVLESGRSVILDASFRTRAMRKRARALADQLSVPFKLVVCRAPRETLVERLRQREGQHLPTDARLEIFEEFEAAWESVEPNEDVAEIDTSSDIEPQLEAFSSGLPLWSAGSPPRDE